MTVKQVPHEYAAAIARYGPSVNRYARQRYGISGQELLAKLTAGESGFDMNAVSSAGARAATQFMPATRAGYIRQYHVDPWKDIDSAEHATAIYLKGAHGDLQAYNPGMASYTKYILGQQVSGLLGGGGGGRRAGAASAAARKPSSGGLGALGKLQDYDPSQALAALQSVLGTKSTPQAVVPSGSPLPDFAAAPVSAGGSGYSSEPIPSGSGGVQAQQPADALAQISALLGPSLASQGGSDASTPQSGSGGAAGGTGGPSGHGGYAYPLARRGKIIGTPYAGTHNLGNWQSDNAIDIATPVGTGVRAIEDGVVVKITPHPQDNGRFAGDQVTIRGAHGGTFYTHLSGYRVRVGQKVHRGQQIGRSGSANGVAHLHIGREAGSPLKEFGG